jgi:CxxC motif-containing protein
MTTTEQSLICIRCPRGCACVATIEDGVVVAVSGNACKRGDRYVRDEVINPVRVVTSSVPVRGSATERMVSVRTRGDVPKGLVRDVVGELRGVVLDAPVSIGDVVIHDVCGTGVDVVATRGA